MKVPTALRPPWLYLARAAWLVLALACLAVATRGCSLSSSGCAAGAVTQADAALAESLALPFSIVSLAAWTVFIARLSMATVAVFIFWKRSDDWVALLLSASLVTVLVEGGYPASASLNAASAILTTIGGAPFLLLPFVFPDGRVEPHRWRWLLVPVAVGSALASGAVLLWPKTAPVNAALTLAWILLAAPAMLYRYRRISSPAERQQIKWVLAGVAATLLVGANYVITPALFPPDQPSIGRLEALGVSMVVYVAGYVFFAAALAMAILRYRLWDIDVLIRRTLIYSFLTALLGLVYFGFVLVLQSLFTALTGQGSSVAVVVSTLAIAALFLPLRARVQDLVDKRFYRRKYDAARALADFSTAARDETDLAILSGRLVSIVDQTMQPEAVTIWLQALGTSSHAGADGALLALSQRQKR